MTVSLTQIKLFKNSCSVRESKCSSAFAALDSALSGNDSEASAAAATVSQTLTVVGGPF
jgi:hypothetical protein